MQRAANKLSIALALLLVGLWCYGCGDGDIMEENLHRYQTDVEFQDAGNEAVLTIDLTRDLDCNDDGNNTDPEPFTEVFANIEIVAAENVPGLRMTSYKVTFKPLTSTEFDGDLVIPPDMPQSFTGTYDVDIPTNSTVSFWITAMEFDFKVYMASQLLLQFPDLTDARYEIEIGMSFIDEYGEPRDITIRRTLYFGYYDNC